MDARLRLRELFNSIKHCPHCVTGLDASPKKFGKIPGVTNVTCHDHGSHSQLESAKSWGSLRRVTGSRRLSHAAVRDLQWWARLSQNEHVGRVLWSDPDAIVFIDASMSGWGAAWNGLVPVSGFFGSSHEGAHINELELLAAIYALKHFVKFARTKSVEIVTDSRVTEFIVRNMTSRSPRLHARLRELRELCERAGVTISTRHIPSVLNCWADRLSRRRDSHEWDLPRAAVKLLKRRFRTKLQLYEGNELPGFIPHFRHPVVLPRPGLLPVWARYFTRHGKDVLVTPQWSTQSWYQAGLRAGAQATLVPHIPGKHYGIT